MGISPGAFKRIAGRLDSTAVTFTVPYASPTTQPVTVTGRRIAADTIQIEETKRATEAGPFARAAYFVRRALPTGN